MSMMPQSGGLAKETCEQLSSSMILSLAIQPAACGLHSAGEQHSSRDNRCLCGSSGLRRPLSVVLHESSRQLHIAMAADNLSDLAPMSPRQSSSAPPCSHPILDCSISIQDMAIDFAFWHLFCAQEAQQYAAKVTEQRVQNAVLRKHLDAKVAANTAASQFIDQLTQQAARLKEEVNWLLAHQMENSSRRPPRAPCHLSTEDLRLQLTALQEQRSKHQENMAGLRSELAVLDSIPEGQLGRVLAGDTTIDELRASEQRLLAEVAARKERKAERQKEIEELCADVSRLEALGTTAEQEAKLRQQFQEAQDVGAALQAQLDAQQQSLQITDSIINGESNSSNSLTSSSRQASTSSESLTPGDSLSLQHSCLQEDSSAVPDKEGFTPEGLSAEDSLLHYHDAVVHVRIAGDQSAGKLMQCKLLHCCMESSECPKPGLPTGWQPA